MKTLYEAANGLEAHMVLDLLRQQGIDGQVEGEHLQGAVGALPALGLVRVVVDEADWPAAQRVIEQWNRAQPPDTGGRPAALAASPGGVAAPWWILAGVLLGWALCRSMGGAAP